MVNESSRLVREQGRRSRAIEALYRLDGRQSKLHPLHGLYTGLAIGYPAPVRWLLGLL
jgi:hypothetical protein